MIRRAFWMGAGAAVGIMSYRRVSALGRQVSGRVTGARGAIQFTRDVREGMDLYLKRGDRPPAPPGMARHHRAAASTLEARDVPGHEPDQKDGR